MGCSELHECQQRFVDYRRHSCRPGRRMDVSTNEDFDEAAVKARVGANIRAQRKKVNMSQGVLAERAGVDRSFISMIERGRGCTVAVLARLAVELGTTPSVLVKDIV